ncbi:osmotically inducible protein Y precursor [Pseudanabaena sp. lw0831]|uniref:BON domain-containing protein n=1 Tax=Pseudanabaena sp. lw0831 TaxID=1357935 RepID=UPI001914F72F|nr:BON domain-containing protein [Pseudanabaena sp. lw0831]GBO55311.1 osmotically inducible protein Y precursor [Pseudanabaena sp. lw0831]
MPTLIAEKTDTEIKTDVFAELKYEPSVKVTDIGVLVKNGTVTLNGYATSAAEKWEAVQATKRVVGVKAIADDIEIKLHETFINTDSDIAAAAIHHIDWFTTIPRGSVKVTVRNGWITLDGEVEWQYLKIAAGHFLHHLSGVKGVSNEISIKPRLSVTEVATDIKSAFKRSAMLDANKIQIDVAGSKVTLKGKVRNYAELEEAERAVWAASGVLTVDNQLSVQWFGYDA